MLTGERVFLNVGTRATIPPIAGLADARPLTHIEALELDRLPAHLIVLGGGYVGLELAQAYRRFGSRVTVVEHGPQLAGREDPDVADAIGQLFADEGIEVLLSAEALQVEGRSGESVRLQVRTPQGERLIEGSDILAATGRTPNTAGIGLDTARRAARWAGLYAGQRPPRDECAGRLGDRRVRRQPPVHARVRGRLSGDPRQPGRGEPDDARPAHPLLSVHGPAPGAGRPQRDRSPEPRRGGARREVADGCRASDADDGGDAAS